nr:hypothetical protein [Nocardia sp. SYP-A9097]
MAISNGPNSSTQITRPHGAVRGPRSSALAQDERGVFGEVEVIETEPGEFSCATTSVGEHANDGSIAEVVEAGAGAFGEELAEGVIGWDLDKLFRCVRQCHFVERVGGDYLFCRKVFEELLKGAVAAAGVLRGERRPGALVGASQQGPDEVADLVAGDIRPSDRQIVLREELDEAVDADQVAADRVLATVPSLQLGDSMSGIHCCRRVGCDRGAEHSWR